MRRERLAWLLGALLVAVAAWWLSTNSEWVDAKRPRPAQGEAATNPVYAFEQMLRKLGMHVEHRESLAALPPSGARLLMLSNDWQVAGVGSEPLHQWVLHGGHLVLMQGLAWDDTKLSDWVPIEAVFRRDDADDAKPGRRAPTKSERRELRMVTLTPALRDGAGQLERVEACLAFESDTRLQPLKGQAAGWQAERTKGVEALRVALGQGSVTVLNADVSSFYSSSVFFCDNALLLSAVAQAQPGATAWVYFNERREPLLPWLWHSGWIALVAGTLALAAALWRGTVRFGPRLAPAPRLRRSIAEQVRGTGAYLLHHGHEALVAAAQRALDEAAARHLPRWRRLPMAQRAEAIALATRLPAEALATAMNDRHCTRAEAADRLLLLESARRLLQQNPGGRTTP